MWPGDCGKMGAMGATTSLMTFEEFERLPEEPNRLELIDGELIRMPPPTVRHGKISQFLNRLLEDIVQELHANRLALDLGRVFKEMGYLIGSNWATPDVSITHAGQPEGEYLEGAPALAVEVISKSNTAEMMQRKVQLYLENGSREVWIFYPRTERVAVHSGKTSSEFSGTLTSDLLPGVSINLTDVFGAQRPGQ